MDIENTMIILMLFHFRLNRHCQRDIIFPDLNLNLPVKCPVVPERDGNPFPGILQTMRIAPFLYEYPLGDTRKESARSVRGCVRYLLVSLHNRLFRRFTSISSLLRFSASHIPGGLGLPHTHHSFSTLFSDKFCRSRSDFRLL